MNHILSFKYSKKKMLSSERTGQSYEEKSTSVSHDDNKLHTCKNKEDMQHWLFSPISSDQRQPNVWK